MKRTILSALLLWMAALAAAAQSYSLDWHAVAGGGGASSGGQFSLSGTIGQPAANLLSGGSYTLQGGFWSVAAVLQTPGAPLLAISRSNGVVVVSWPAPATGFVLQQTTSLAGPSPSWTAIPASQYQTAGTNLTFTVTAPAGYQFFRLQAP